MASHSEIYNPKTLYQEDYLPFGMRSNKGIKIYSIEILIVSSRFKLIDHVKACSDNPDDFQRPKIHRNTLAGSCLDYSNERGKAKSTRNKLFASTFPVSEYMDNIGRIGNIILDRNLHYHKKCRRNNCEQPCKNMGEVQVVELKAKFKPIENPKYFENCYPRTSF